MPRVVAAATLKRATGLFVSLEGKPGRSDSSLISAHAAMAARARREGAAVTRALKVSLLIMGCSTHTGPTPGMHAPAPGLVL